MYDVDKEVSNQKLKLLFPVVQWLTDSYPKGI